MSKSKRLREQWLHIPERNNFFYGKLMDAAQFEKETSYFQEMRYLINRLVLGSGVVRGLNVINSPTNPGLIRILAGMAIDPWGREIIVPLDIEKKPSQLTDNNGNPVAADDPVKDVEICLAYTESKTELVPVLVPECETKSNCAPNTIQENYVVLIRPYVEPPREARNGLELDGLSPEDLPRSLCQHLLGEPPEVVGEGCLPLARVLIGAQDQRIKVEPCIRPLVYNNTLLFALILDLAARIKKLEPDD